MISLFLLCEVEAESSVIMNHDISQSGEAPRSTPPFAADGQASASSEDDVRPTRTIDWLS